MQRIQALLGFGLEGLPRSAFEIPEYRDRVIAAYPDRAALLRQGTPGPPDSESTGEGEATDGR
jgi:hypothetical protein